jgi:outer membrane murein-binding lipoprotein Lpp
MAQVIISGPDNDAARHQYHADQQEHAAQRDAYKARVDAAHGDYGAAQHEQNKAIEHQEDAQHQEHRAVEDSQPGR